MDSTDSHVHFKTEDVSTHESEIEVVPGAGSAFDIHLGFLQIRHVYHVTFCITHKLGKEITYDPLECLLVKVKEVTPIENGHKLVVEFNALKEKLMKEKITIQSATSDDMLCLIFHARVLGKHKGTPSLRAGVHCIRIEPDDEEESDWQGF